MVCQGGGAYGRGEIFVDVLNDLICQQIGSLISHLCQKRAYQLCEYQSHIRVQDEIVAGTFALVIVKLFAHLGGDAFDLDAFITDKSHARRLSFLQFLGALGKKNQKNIVDCFAVYDILAHKFGLDREIVKFRIIAINREAVNLAVVDKEKITTGGRVSIPVDIMSKIAPGRVDQLDEFMGVLNLVASLGALFFFYRNALAVVNIKSFHKITTRMILYVLIITYFRVLGNRIFSNMYKKRTIGIVLTLTAKNPNDIIELQKIFSITSYQK
jgi:hypothetical protein